MRKSSFFRYHLATLIFGCVCAAIAIALNFRETVWAKQVSARPRVVVEAQRLRGWPFPFCQVSVSGGGFLTTFYDDKLTDFMRFDDSSEELMENWRLDSWNSQLELAGDKLGDLRWSLYVLQLRQNPEKI